MKRIFFSIAVVSLFAVSCKDDDTTPTRTQLLTGRAWRIVEMTVDGDDALAECLEDDEFTFDQSGDIEWNTGSDECYTGQPTIIEGEWEFDDNDTVFIWDFEGDAEPDIDYEILELTSEVFRIEQQQGNQIITFETIE
jgi:hypothetical protein